MTRSLATSLLRRLGLWTSRRNSLGADPAAPRYLRHPGVQQIVHDDQTVLVVPFSDPLVLNDVATFIWDELACPRDEGDLLSALLQHYEVDRRTAANDLADHLTECLARHLVLRLSAPRSAPIGPCQAHAPRPIAEEEIIPSTLVVRVFSHRLSSLGGSVNCWSLVSDGLLSAAQKEIVFTVKREAGEGDLDYPRELLRLYSMFHLLALQGRTIDVGGFSSLASGSGLVERPDFRNIVYSTPQFLDGVHVAEPFLTAIVLTDDEFQVAQQYGIVRATTLLGGQYRFFPCAPWADRKRGSVATPKDMEDSVLAKVRKMTVPGPVVYLAGQTVSRERVGMTCGLSDRLVRFTDQRVKLEVPVGAHRRIEDLLEGVPDDAPIAILSNPDPLADALLCWSPGSGEPHCISTEGSRGLRIGGNFVLFVPGQTEDAVIVHEDGFAVKATRPTWKSIRESLAAGTGLNVPARGDGMGFEIVWHEDAEMGRH